jgi:flagellar hook protein FlgE
MFRVALSGLNAASSDLRVTANNIANVNTTGFKGSRAEFGDVFAVSPYGVGRNAIGAGVQLSRVAQQFGQGNIEFTENSLDLAINGEGFFTLSQNGALSYSRAGAFGVDREGFVVNARGQRLQVNPPVAGAAGFDTGRLTDLQLQTTDSPPQATTSVALGLTLPGNATAPALTPFNATDARTYNHTTSITVYDSLGVSHVASFYFVKTGTANQWQVHSFVDGTAVGAAQNLTYSNSGALTAPAGGLITLPAHTLTNGAAPLNIELDLSNSAQFGERFATNSLTQDGYATGRLVGVDVSPEGVVNARYTNGQSTPLGQISLTRFANSQGLQQLGDTSWSETFESGDAVRGQAGSGSFGLVQSGALESSNVDLTAQLVNMITAQRNFQANAQMISTADQVTQAIINIR